MCDQDSQSIQRKVYFAKEFQFKRQKDNHDQSGRLHIANPYKREKLNWRNYSESAS